MEQSKNNFTVDPKDRLKLHLLYISIFISGDIGGWVMMWFAKVMTPVEIFHLTARPLYIILSIVKYAFIYIFYHRTVSKLFKVYDGTHEKLVLFEKCYGRIVKTIIPFEAFVVCLYIPNFIYLIGRYGLNVNRIAFSMVLVGSASTITSSMFVFYKKRLDNALKKVPFEHGSKISMGTTERGVVVTSFSFYGHIFALVGAFIAYSHSDLTIAKFILTAVLPVETVMIGCCAWTVYNLYHESATNIRTINKILGRIFNNDYTKKIEGVTSRDEFGAMAFSINSAIDSSREVFTEIQNSAMTSHSMARELAVSTTASYNSVEKIVDSIGDMKNSVMSETDAFASINESSETMSNTIGLLEKDVMAQSTAVEQSSAAIEQMVSNIRSITSILEKNAKTVANLSAAANEGKAIIGQSVISADKILKDSAGLLEASSVIQNIASQTNLLAMNAAIEAAHAGAAGQGFAVVADEIRKLAEDSNTQGKNITQSLKRLQESIKEISVATQTANTSFNTIYGLTDDVHNQEDVIKAAVDEQASGSEQVLQAVRLMTETTSNVKDGARTMSKNNDDVSRNMEKMSAELENFNNVMGIVSFNASEISKAISDTKEYSETNNVSIQKLATLVNKFKISEEKK